MLSREPERFAGFFDVVCEREQRLRRSYPCEEHSRLMRVGVPAKAANANGNWSRPGHRCKRTLQLIEPIQVPCADEFGCNVKIVIGAPLDRSQRPQMFEHQLQIAADRIFDGKASKEPKRVWHDLKS